MKFYEKLIFLRKQKGLSQEELANELDVSRQTVYKWEAGLNMPDMPKLERLTSYFNVSYNYLLDEKIEASQTENAPTPAPAPSRPKFRDVFVSATKLDYDQSGYEHGYVPDAKGAVKNSEYLFEQKKINLKNHMRKKGYSNIVSPQHDLCMCYFEDSKSKTFGFYFNGAEQFVCPFENFLDVQITNDGYSMNYNRRTTMVGVGFGDVSSVSLGSIPQASLDKPKYFTVTIVYLNKNGDHKEYKLEFSANRLYYFEEYKKADEATLLMNCLSDITLRGLNEIATKLMGVKGQRELIQSGEFELPDVNVVQLKQDSTKIRSQDLQEKAKLQEEYAAARKKRSIAIAIAVGVAVCIAAIIFFISNA